MTGTRQAQVDRNRVHIVFENEHRGPGVAYTAWCPDCTLDGGPVNWHGRPHIIGYGSAPELAALGDAWEHDQEKHAEPLDAP